MLDCNIRDFTSVSISGEIALPEAFPKSYPIENKIKYLTKVREVFDPSKIEEFERAIRASHEFMPRFPFNGGERRFFVADTIDHFSVQFKNGQVQINSITSSKFNKQSLAVKEILIIAMERLAKELNWEGTTHKISCNAIERTLGLPHFGKSSYDLTINKGTTRFRSSGVSMPIQSCSTIATLI